MKVRFAVFAVTSLLVVAPAPASAATIFFFEFDNSGGGPDGTVSAPIVGNGTFVSPTDLSPGTYNLTALPGFSLNLAFGAEQFTTFDIATPLEEVAVEITSVSRNIERLVFTEDGGAADGGPFNGTLDLQNGAGDALSFAPSSFGHNLYFETGASSSLGNYAALSAVPEAATWAMMLAGLGAIGLFSNHMHVRGFTALTTSRRR